MNTFNLVIASPEGNLYDGKAEMIILRGSEGDLAIMAGHIPFITSVKPCECKIILEGGEERSGAVDGGLLTVSEEKVTLLSSSFKW